MPALLTQLPTAARAARASNAAPRRVRAVRAAARVSARHAGSPSEEAKLGRRGAALGLGAAFLAGFAGGTSPARAVECNMVTPCMPGTEPGAPPRYVLPGPAYSPAEAAEERFRAERAAEKAAYETQFKREQAAAEAAEAAKAAEAAP